ncbi:MAG: ABC transporter permease subunit [Phycisphaerales bacterium]|nr:ABC transporter permease subunit [Phycisphaerales bacterium]
MKIKDRINESPSLRKLFANRSAVIAMGIISLYLILFVWIISMQFLSSVGNTTGLFDISDRPVMGAMLPERALDRVGASNEPGFGMTSEPSKRTEQAKFYFEQVRSIFVEMDQAEVENGHARTLEEVLEANKLAELRVVDRPIEELREIYERGMSVFDKQDTLRKLRPKIVKIDIALEKLEGFSQEIQNTTDQDSIEFENLCEDTGYTLEDVINYLEEYSEIAPVEDDPLALIDTSLLVDAMDALLDYEPLDPVYDLALIQEIQSSIDIAGDGIDNAVDAKLIEVEPILNELFPQPVGIKGVIYKFRMMLGTDQQGRSIMLRALYSAKIAIQVGLIVSFIAVLFGSIIGAAAGYFGGFIDHLVIWLYSTFSSIPYLVLLVVLAFMFTGSIFEGTLIPLYVAFCLTYWIGPCRVTRGEALKLKSLDYVQAAQALGASKARILLKHIIPNTSHLMFINSSLLFIGAIKGEVVLTFLGLGLKEGASWGIMISQSKPEVVSGFFWQIGAATFFMFVLVLAFNILTDALQDAFDPKHVG